MYEGGRETATSLNIIFGYVVSLKTAEHTAGCGTPIHTMVPSLNAIDFNLIVVLVVLLQLFQNAVADFISTAAATHDNDILQQLLLEVLRHTAHRVRYYLHNRGLTIRKFIEQKLERVVYLPLLHRQSRLLGLEGIAHYLC